VTDFYILRPPLVSLDRLKLDTLNFGMHIGAWGF